MRSELWQTVELKIRIRSEVPEEMYSSHVVLNQNLFRHDSQNVNYFLMNHCKNLPSLSSGPLKLYVKI